MQKHLPNGSFCNFLTVDKVFIEQGDRVSMSQWSFKNSKKNFTLTIACCYFYLYFTSFATSNKLNIKYYDIGITLEKI